MRRILLLVSGLLILISGCTQTPLELELPTPTARSTYTPMPTLTVMPTYTLQPTLTIPVYPTATTRPTFAINGSEKQPDSSAPVYMTVTPFAEPTKLIPVSMEQEFPCGKWLGITVTYMIPKLQGTLSEHFPVGKFLLMRVRLRGLQEDSNVKLLDRSFTLLGSLYGRNIRISLDRPNSDYANSRWETPKLDTSIGFNGYETFIVFDVNPLMTNYELLFEPVTAEQTDPICSLSLPLPIAYY